MARHPNRPRSGTMRPVTEARDVYVRRRLTALGTVGVVALAAGALVGAGGGSGGGGSEQSRAAVARTGAPDAAAGRPADLPGPARRRLLRRAAGPRAGRARHRHARPGGAPGSSARRGRSPSGGGPCCRRSSCWPRSPTATPAPTASTARARTTAHPPLPARRAAPQALLLLDIQPGHADFLDEAAPPPSAGCASPTSGSRWTPSGTRPARCPGRGSAPSTAGEVNAVARYVARLVRAGDLPAEALRRPPVHRGHGHREAHGARPARARRDVQRRRLRDARRPRSRSTARSRASAGASTTASSSSTPRTRGS